MVKIKNRFEREGPPLMEMPTESKVETTGYRTNKEQIETLIRSGRLLEAYRHALYEGSGRMPTGRETVARHYGEVDMVDAERKRRAIGLGLKEALRDEAQRNLDKARETTSENTEVSMGTESSSRPSAQARTKPGTKGDESPE